ncbi:MAG: hypothetical protein AAB676_09370 [Verrucomicrobiota bacterium]
MKEYDWRQRFSSLIAVMLSAAMPCANPLCAAEKGAKPEELAKPVMENFMKSPAVFIENRGQWGDEKIRFALSSQGANVGLTDQGPRFRLFQRKSAGAPNPARGHEPTAPVEIHLPVPMKEFSAHFVGARRVTPLGEGKSQQLFHYRRGEPGYWRENVPSWDAAVYRGLYDGIDLRVTGRQAGIKYEFLVAPGADWRQVRLRYDGIEQLVLREDGGLNLQLGEGWMPLVDGAPVIYQELDGQKVKVAGHFELVDDKTCAFEITGDYDRARPLVIDPEVE